MGGIVHLRLEILVKDGPYRYIRHHVYLDITIAFSGIPIAMKSWPGLIAVFLLFLPSKTYRVKLEEKALAKKFGGEWKSYALRTGFFLPFIGKGK